MKFSSIVGAVVFALGAFAPSAFSQVRVTSWDDLVSVCQNPQAVNLQRPPSQVTATCNLTRTSWRQTGQMDEVSFPGQDQLQFEGASDKTQSLTLEQTVALEDQVLQCPRAEQVQKNYTISFETSCDEIIGFEGDFAQFCYDRMGAQNGGLEQYLADEVVVEGSEMSLCAVQTTPQEEPGQQEQDDGQAEEGEQEQQPEEGEQDDGAQEEQPA